MVRITLKGVAKVSAKGRTYYYAWRGGPRLRGERGRGSSARATTRRSKNTVHPICRVFVHW
jgi:uncharacterized ParB-like nuclease family protein